MKRFLVTGFVVTGLVGLIFGCQQSTSVLLSSLHDLAVFPRTSWIAISFILLIHATIFGILGLIFSFLFRKKDEKWLIPANFGLGIALSVFIFLFGRFQSVFHKKIVAFSILTASGLIGAVFGFFFFTLIFYLEKKKKNWFLLGRFLAGVFLIAFIVLVLVIGSSTLGHFLNGIPGLPKKPRLNQPATADKPNIVLLTIDAQRADHLGVYGYQEKVSSNIDEIAQKGIVFENTFVNAPWTLPSLASMFSSRLPTELKISVDNLSFGQIEQTGRLTTQVETIAERMQTLGYNTQAVFTNELLASARGFEQGFDGFVNLEKLMPYHYHFHFKNMALTRLLNQFFGGEKTIEGYYTFLVGPSGPKQFETPAWEINRWLLPCLENFKDFRFFLWAHYIDPHAPYDPGSNYSPDLSVIGPGRESELRQASAHQPDKIRWREIDKESVVKLYDGDVSLVDAAIGQVWQKLNQLGLMERTILIISADHGEEFWDHGGMGHGRTLYQEVIRVPLIIVGPGIESKRVFQNISLLDLFPTIIDLVGENIPKNISGRSFKSLIEGRSLPDEAIISEGTGRGTERRAIIIGDYKLIHDFFTNEDYLFDLRQDQKDEVNLSGLKPGTVRLMREQLLTIEEQLRENRQKIFKEPEPAGPPLGDVVGY